MTRSLESPGAATDELRHAVAEAVHAVYFGAAIAAGLAFLVLLFVAPRRFPVLASETKEADDTGEAVEAHDEGPEDTENVSRPSPAPRSAP